MSSEKTVRVASLCALWSFIFALIIWIIVLAFYVNIAYMNATEEESQKQYTIAKIMAYINVIITFACIASTFVALIHARKLVDPNKLL